MSNTRPSLLHPGLGAAAVFGMLACNFFVDVPIVVPSDITEQTELLEPRGRSLSRGFLVDESFSLGNYQVKSVSRGLETNESTGHDLSLDGSGLHLRPTGTLHTAKFDYVLKGSGGALAGKCRTREADAEEDSFSELSCKCGEATLQILYEPNGATYRVKLGSAAVAVTPLSSEGNFDWGYRVEGEGVLAAVDRNHPGRVWLRPSMPEEVRQPLVCLFAGVLLR